MSPSVDGVLGPEGRLASVLERYEYRPQQLEMAKGVARALEDRHPLVVEAATGTGKTLAYLVPAILSGKRVVISTGTKALQEQLFRKDIPLLQECLDESFEAVLLKGRRNYLCHYRFREMRRKKQFRRSEDVKLWPTILSWAANTEVGDRAEIPGMPDEYPTWQELSVGSEGCLGTSCEFWEDCYVQKARARAKEADLIVVNHHLFFADLALKDEGFGEILPPYDAVIFDEAHHVEKVATDYFGTQVSVYRFRDLGSDVDRAIEDEEMDGLDAGPLREATSDMERVAGKLFDALGEATEKGRHGLEEVLEESDSEEVGRHHRELGESLEELASVIKRSSLGEVGQRLAERCGELTRDMASVLEGEQEDVAYIAESRDSGLFLQAAPIDLAAEMKAKLLATHDAMVFTSATLTTGGDFGFFRRRLGLEGKVGGEALDVQELSLEPVFDYGEQSLIYVPKKLPAPSDPEFCKNMALIVEYLTDITEGRAFILFTSYLHLHDVHERLEGRLDYPVLKQGEASKRELLEEFRAQEGAVLFATASFWEGVDVEGDDLSLVVIDKLPFANPSDPLTRARLERCESEGGNSFRDISLPTAAITLRQGVGRLIRSKEDVGVVAVLDSRIANRRYGRYFLDSLPDAPVVWKAPRVKAWWYHKHDLMPSTEEA